jgi:predicted AAA+ superfamily ATPase
LKGIYDRAQRHEKILVTGSARLDLYRFGGDSLQGRYHFLRLHPLSVAELGIKSQADFELLLHLGGFPEPFLGGSQLEARRWAREYRTRLIREDLAGVEMIQDLGNLELLMLRLPDLVGSPLSQNALSGDLGVSPKTVGRWLDAFERLYAIFRLPPLGSPRLRAIRKSQKHYHLDWTLIAEPGPRFENMVAGHLLKWVHFLEDSEGRDVELRYFRDVDGREVDFIILENHKPWMAIECKLGDGEISRGLHYFHDRFPECQTFQIAAQGKKQYRSPEGIRVIPAMKFLQTLV